jgi:protein-S-isoprenylcysteine O-methyltransferase Ste14
VRALPPSSRYADARCAGQWAWSRRFQKTVAIQPLNALTGHGCVNIVTGREGSAVRKTFAVLGSALFFVVAPLMLAGFVPWWITHWEFRPAFFGFELTRAIGLVLIIAGAPGIVDSFARFALQGLGTPAPIAPPQKLVVTGLYRYVRNPIYVGVVAVIFGQAFLFSDQRLLWYAALLWLFFHVWVLVVEEPTLKETFGAQYEDFRANVPRWIPRLPFWRAARRRKHS